VDPVAINLRRVTGRPVIQEDKMATYIDVLDTAVKIGLGALISGAASYWQANLKDKSERKNKFDNRRHELLEKIASQVEEFNHIYLKLAALVIEGRRHKDEWPTHRREEYDLVKTEIFHAFKHLTDSESKALLLGEKEIFSKIRDYGTLAVKFRKTAKVYNDEITDESVIDQKEAIATAREVLFDELSRVYRKDFV
jgi:hypothetical protein